MLKEFISGVHLSIIFPASTRRSIGSSDALFLWCFCETAVYILPTILLVPAKLVWHSAPTGHGKRNLAFDLQDRLDGKTRAGIGVPIKGDRSSSNFATNDSSTPSDLSGSGTPSDSRATDPEVTMVDADATTGDWVPPTRPSSNRNSIRTIVSVPLFQVGDVLRRAVRDRPTSRRGRCNVIAVRVAVIGVLVSIQLDGKAVQDRRSRTARS